MTARTTAATVVDSYQQRARFSRAETATVHHPRLLRGLLPDIGHVAEIPCGAGHFLDLYATADVAVTLIDACPAMLVAAVKHAVEVGLPTDRTHPRVAYLQDLGQLSEVDLVVVPNAALNQLACQSSLPDTLAALRRAVRLGAQVLAQLACTYPGGGVDTAGFYDVERQDRVWFADRWFSPAHAGRAVLRRRRQHRIDHRLRIEFDYRDTAGRSLHTTTVELFLFSATELSRVFTDAGFGHVRFLPGMGGLSEVLATAETGDRR